MIVLDTSALIQFFTRDDETKAQKVKAVLESNEDLLLLDAVLLELIFTLTKVYNVTRIQIVEILKYLLSRPNIQVSAETRKAIKIYESNNLSISDCLVIAHGEGHKIASFDKNLLGFEGVKSAL